MGSAPEGGREPGMSSEEEGGGMLLEMEALAEENEQLKARMERSRHGNRHKWRQRRGGVPASCCIHLLQQQ